MEFEIRDLRKKEKFVVDDEYLNGYAKKCGIYATGVYISLCRHADKDQKCWPSHKKIAEELNVSEASIKRGFAKLLEYKIIHKERLGKKLNNRYYLLDKSEWSNRPITITRVIGLTDQSMGSHRPITRGLTDQSIVRKHNIKETHSKDLAPQGGAERKDQVIFDLIEKFKCVNPSYEQLFKNTNQRAALERMIKKWGTEKVGRWIDDLPKIINQPFAPRATTPIQLESKLGELAAFTNQKKNNQRTIIKI